MRTMNRLWGIMTALALILPFAAFGQSTAYYDRSYTRMSYVQGDVFVQRAQDQGYEKGEINLVVVQGDKIGSRAGRLEIQLGLRNYLRLDNDTQVDLVNLPGRDGDPTKLHVLAGSIFLRVQTLDRAKNFEVHTPDASFYLLTAGSYRVDVRENRETEFSVLSGSAEAAAEEGSVAIEDGQRIVAANGRFASEAVSLLARRDDFGGWNETRDAGYARPSGQTYLPAQYADYETELADNGSWVDEPEYGSVWVPRGVYSDWRPYSNGRWVWYPIIGWTWVSYDSWGWATHHYGRWGWGSGLGWYWIPRDHWGWGPAWVNWWNDDYYVGWCPLSYWGYPGVIYNNRFYGRYGRGDYYNYGHFARSMTVVDRNRLWDRNIGRSALGADRLRGHVDRVSLGGQQPNIRPNINRGDGIATRAASVLGRENLRSISRGYDSGARRLSTDELRTSIGRGRSGEISSPGSRTIRDGGAVENRGITSRSRENISGNTGRQIRSYPSGGNPHGGLMRSQPLSRSGEAGSSTGRSLSTNGSASSNARRIREYSGSGRSSSSSGSISRSTTGRIDNSASSSMRSYPSRSAGSSSGRDISPRSSSSSLSSSGLREYGSRSSIGRSGGSSSNSYSRSSSAPARSYSAPSRSYSAPSRSSGSSSNSYSRSSSAPTRSYSAPTRSYSAPSRSYSAPSRSYSAPSRSYSAPSRSSSSGSSSRSYSAPSRSSSSSGSSRSSSSSSSGRSSGGSVRRK